MAYLNDLTSAQVRALLDYDPLTGIFRWRSRPPLTYRARAWNSKWAGKIAGSPKQGYVRIKIAGVFYAGHRLAWLHHYGQWPDGDLDHRDKNRSNTRIDNLRPATHSQNMVNRPIQKNSVSGLRGVAWNRHVNKWQAAICVKGKSLHLGCFEDKHVAAEAYAAAAALHYGEFAP